MDSRSKQEETMEAGITISSTAPAQRDRFSALPAELILLIFSFLFLEHELFDPLYSPSPNCFGCIAKVFLHAQYVNLYRHVVIQSLDDFRILCRSIEGNPALGTMVKRLDVPYKRLSPDYKVLVSSLSKYLKQIDSIELPFSPIAQIFFPPFDAPTAAMFARLRSLTAEVDGPNHLDQLPILCPNLDRVLLSICDVASYSESAIASAATEPHRLHMSSLTLCGGLDRLGTQRLASLVDSRTLDIKGTDIGSTLTSFTNPQYTTSLYVGLPDEWRGSTGELDSSVLRFVNLRELTIAGDGAVISEDFFTNLFRTMSSLVHLIIGEGFPLVVADLHLAITTVGKPAALRHLQVDSFHRFKKSDRVPSGILSNWTDECDVGPLLDMIEAFQRLGIELTGSTIEAIEFEDEYESGSDLQ